MKTFLLCLASFLLINIGFAQPNNGAVQPWDAKWITVPNENPAAYGVYFFRKTIQLDVIPAEYRVRVSADNRYKLYVNQQLVSAGPARSDMYYWNYETVDIAPFLKTGKNTVAALVWNEADFRPEAQISLRAGFILQGDSQGAAALNTGQSWQCLRDSSRQPLPGCGFTDTYYVAGPGEIVDMRIAIKNWMNTDFDDSKWLAAREGDRGKPKGAPDAFGWMLVPSTLPQMERTLQRIPVLRSADGVAAPPGFPAQKTAFTIPANTTATVILDQTYLTNALVTLDVSGGKNATVSLTYAEALFNYQGRHRYKTNRDDIDGKVFLGRKDSILCDGTDHQVFNTMTWRTYRYIRLRVTTGNAPLTVNDLYGTFTAYPFQLNAQLHTGRPDVDQILATGWRTARLCAAETYMDCPYYEQLQYIGDSRIQALISYYNSGDDRLARNAITEMQHSQLAEGITQSRSPSYSPQIISTFSLWYVSMIHDYWMYRPDSNFVKEKLNSVRNVLNFFSKYQQADGSLKNTPYWTFVDWVDNRGWASGMPPLSPSGHSAILEMQLLMAYQQAAAMEARLGMPAFAVLYREKATQLKATIKRKYWDYSKNLFTDIEDKQTFSQHANALAVLTGLVSDANRHDLCEHILNDTSLTKATIYFKYYVHHALIEGGLGDGYIDWLDQWRTDIKTGLTTWAETSDLENTRSDCHAWGASPNIEFYRTLLGIDSDAPGFAKVKIAPHLGKLTDVSGEIPHPNGKIAASYKLQGGKWKISISLPAKTSGVLIWKGKRYLLKSGVTELVV